MPRMFSVVEFAISSKEGWRDAAHLLVVEFAMRVAERLKANADEMPRMFSVAKFAKPLLDYNLGI